VSGNRGRPLVRRVNVLHCEPSAPAFLSPALAQSSSASRFTAGAAGFLNLSKSLVRPER
jgi:hypothetical protein